MLKRLGWWLNKYLWRPLICSSYGGAYEGSWYHVKTFFIWQKLFRINGDVPWFVHYSSQVSHWQKIKMKAPCHPGMSVGNYIQACNGIELGKHILIGPNVGLISANHDVNDHSKWVKSPPIRIGDNVWIGMNAVILPGVIIGDNVVVGAGAVVNIDIPSNAYALGSPCRIVLKKKQEE